MASAYAALVSLLNTIGQIKKHPHLSTCLHNELIPSLVEKADLLLHFIEGYNHIGVVSSKQVEDLEKQITSAAHTAEDVIELHISNQIQGRPSDNGESSLSFLLYTQKKMGPAIQDHVDQFRKGLIEASLSCSHYLQLIIRDMDLLIYKANELKEKHAEEHLQFAHPTLALTETATTSMVGFGQELIQLMDELTNQRSGLHAISIVGMGGMGKTTLAQNLYQNPFIKEHFYVRAWATVTQQYKANEIITQLLSCLKNVEAASALGDQLYKTLYGRRYLVVLDDIWSVGPWDELRRFFPDNRNGSRILLTTRLSNVANDCGSSCFPKNLLDPKESWELFCEKVFHKHEDCPPELVGVGKMIVELCKGLPLSIVVIGGSLLKSPRTLGYWENVARDIEYNYNSKEKQESLDVLYSSYNHLPARLKPCFLYIGVYKMLWNRISVPNMIRLWVAEGFLKSNSGQDLEEIAEDYLKDLIDRNLISVGKQSVDGRMKSCYIHDVLRDLCLKLCEQQEFFYVITWLPQGTERRLIYDTYMRKIAITPPLARSILGNANKAPKLELDKQRLLRVLEIEFGGELSPSGGVNLRYLVLKRPETETGTEWISRLWELPKSVSLAWNLHTLILRIEKPYGGFVAPLEIWKMRPLRHVECSYIYLPDPCISMRDGQDELIVMENLRTLKKAVNLKLSEEVCKIIPHIKNIDLLYDCGLQGYDRCMIECLRNLNCFHKLESLWMEIRGSEFPIRTPGLNKILRFPSSLKKMTLVQCELHWDDLTIIGLLPLLEVLKLQLNGASRGKCWNASSR